jgi:hypothetical protein
MRAVTLILHYLYQVAHNGTPAHVASLCVASHGTVRSVVVMCAAVAGLRLGMLRMSNGRLGNVHPEDAKAAAVEMGDQSLVRHQCEALITNHSSFTPRITGLM